MSATTEQKARFLDLVTGTLEMVRDGKRAIEPILTILQGIKDEVNFAQRLLAKTMIIWKTIMVGGLSKDKLLKRLVDSGRNVSDWAKDIMSKSAFKMSTKPHEVSFVRVKVRDLGFTQNPTTTELFARIKEVGELCQPEDGPWLALQDQPCGDIFWLAMEPITDSDGYPKVFDVERYDDGKRWLNTNYANPDNHWNLDDEIVFRSRKLFYFSALSGVCFMSCPLQPPSIFPTSSTLVERKIYFLLSNDLVSQRIIKNTLAVSIFLKAYLTKGNFSPDGKKLAVIINSSASTKRESIL